MVLPKNLELDQAEYDALFDDIPYFCGDIEDHEPHDDEGTWSGRYSIHTCPGVLPLFPIEKDCGS